jgi:hypothetical protein
VQRQLQDAERKCQTQERAIERIHVDFQHFLLLMDRAVSAGDGNEDAAASSNPEAVLERLRHLAASAVAPEA